ncbi:MAG: hypothetical protein WCG43_05940 [Actinomycetes bacterium]
MSDLISVAIVGKSSQDLATSLNLSPVPLEESDLAIFIVSAVDGIVRADIDSWQFARDMYIPSIVVISETDDADLDFDDMTAIASKMLDPVASKYLVLHSDTGAPTALIDLTTLKILDYSTGVVAIIESDDEHKELVGEYVLEYQELLEQSGDDGFTRGLLFPALPWLKASNLGLDQIKELINQIPAAG